MEDGKALCELWKQLRELWNQLRNKQLPYICESESVHLAVTKFILNCIKMSDSYCVITSFYDCTEVLKNLCDELGVKLSELVVCNWANFKCFPRHLLDELVDKMISFHMPDSPPSAIMVQAVLDFLSKDVKHDLRDLLVLKFFRHGDKNLIKIFSLIKANQANYTPAALLHVAQKWKQNQYYSVQINSTNLFSHEVENLITYALQGIAKEAKEDHSGASFNRHHGFFLPSYNPYSDVQWVFQSFLEKPTTVVVKSKQWLLMLDFIQKAFSEDLPTILSLFSCLEDHKLLVQKCRTKFGENVVKMINQSVVYGLDNIHNRQYNNFLEDLKKAKEYFTKCANKGLQEFRQLLKKIKQERKNKKKLMDGLSSTFPTLMSDL